MLQKNDWRIMSQDSYIHGRSLKKMFIMLTVRDGIMTIAFIVQKNLPKKN